MSSFFPQAPEINRPTLNLPAHTIEQATTTIDARRVPMPQEVPTWLVSQVVALAEAAEKDTEILTNRYGAEVAKLLSPGQGAPLSRDTAYILLACSTLAGSPSTSELTKLVNSPISQSHLHNVGLALSIEISLFSEDLVNNLFWELGTPNDYALYHERSRTLIPIICERGIITTVDCDLFNNPTELAAEAARLIEAYKDIADAEGLKPLSRVGFYTHGWDKELGNITQCKVIDTSLF